MSDEEDYHTHQYRAEELRQQGFEHEEEWMENEEENNRELLAHLEAERRGREKARDEYGDDADSGHDERIEKLKDMEQTIKNRLAYLKGEYSYDHEEQEEEQEEEEEEEEDIEQRGDEDGENGCDEVVDMDIVSDSDSD